MREAQVPEIARAWAVSDVYRNWFPVAANSNWIQEITVSKNFRVCWIASNPHCYLVLYKADLEDFGTIE